jgi:predicted phosphatase
MNVIKSEHNIMVDVDGTLIDHLTTEQLNEPIRLTVSLWCPIENKNITVGVNQSMVRLLKEEYHRGSHVVVWSRGGWEWATNVVRALNLEKYVDLVMTKPLVYFDDIEVQEWLKYRVFIKHDTIYKR